MVATLTSILSTGGRITIPVAIRRALNLMPGDRIHFVQIDAGCFEIVPANRPVTELKGLLGKPTKKGSIAKIRL